MCANTVSKWLRRRSFRISGSVPASIDNISSGQDNLLSHLINLICGRPPPHQRPARPSSHLHLLLRVCLVTYSNIFCWLFITIKDHVVLVKKHDQDLHQLFFIVSQDQGWVRYFQILLQILFTSRVAAWSGKGLNGGGGGGGPGGDNQLN